MDYKQAVEELYNGNIAYCIDFFRTNGYKLEYAYSLFLSDKLDEASEVLKDIDSVRADWLLKLISLIRGKKVYPTYFQIRCFLEIDLTLFLKTQKIDYINVILKNVDAFQMINTETYKLLGRGFLKNDFPKESKYFLDKSLNAYYNDVELHYLFVEYYLYHNDYKNAKIALENCMKINPEYYPAKKTSKELAEVNN